MSGDRRGVRNPNWKGGRTVHQGYVLLHRPDHPHCDNDGYVRKHRLVVEEVLERRLPRSAVVHHRNGNRSDNRPKNLIVCESHGYHMTLERRQRALEKCGDADGAPCQYCGVYGSGNDDGFTVTSGATRCAYHKRCHASAQREYRAKS